MRCFAIVLAACCGAAAWAQTARLIPSSAVAMPAPVDSNSPAFRQQNGEFRLLNSTFKGPIMSSGSNQFSLDVTQNVQMRPVYPWAFWMESVWKDPASGLVYGWYHQEFGPCPAGNDLAVPRIGAAVSYDDGVTFLDLGSIITSGSKPDCDAKNGYTAGGVGDFSVILDQQHKYFYFLYSSYAGRLENEGICIARMPFESRSSPGGMVRKYYDGAWDEPGLDGRDFAIFPAKALWQRANTNSYWGPSVHWNTYLQKYVMLLNHSCCAPRYPQDGIFIAYNSGLGNPAGWSEPVRLIDNSGWYPQVIGLGEDGSDRLAGRAAQFYIAGKSAWRIVFEP